MKEYEFTMNGLRYTILCTAEQAERYPGAKPVEDKAKAPANKSRTPANKAD